MAVDESRLPMGFRKGKERANEVEWRDPVHRTPISSYSQIVVKFCAARFWFHNAKMQYVGFLISRLWTLIQH